MAVSLSSILSNLSFSIQNCNSLNVSTCCPKQLKKIEALTSYNSNIVFLSDLRLNNSDCVSDLKRIFLSGSTNQFDFFFNSSRSKRGVGILISKKIDFQILDTFRDANENILGLHIVISNHNFLLISIYGPNSVDPVFFSDLRRCLAVNPDANIICGGDWNLTYSTADTALNLDIFRMNSPPSLIRSRALADVCELYLLSDPFRALHPDRRDFSYRPKNGQNNRSRLDFFIVSDSLLFFVSKCEISVEIATELFDHHSVSLSFNNKNFKPRLSINNVILKHPRFLDVALAAAADTYLSHASDNNPHINIAAGRLEVGAFLLLLREINDLEYDIELNGSTPEKILEKDNKSRNLELSRNNMPTPEQLDQINRSCPDDTFLEVLMGNIRNSIISFQSWTKKVSTLKKSLLVSRINSLRDNFIVNSNEISALQEELNRLVELEIREKILNMKLFEGLHSEKPTPMFLALAKNKNTGNLSLMKDATGSDFASLAEQGEYIASYYENLYRAPPNEDLENNRIVEDFLGPEICASELVSNSKITEGESLILEAPLSIDELDKSINNCNLRSAAGMDGFNNRVIKKCWNLLRIPLLNYANHCFNTGELTSNFRGACIRLIPKKVIAPLLRIGDRFPSFPICIKLSLVR